MNLVFTAAQNGSLLRHQWPEAATRPLGGLRGRLTMPDSMTPPSTVPLAAGRRRLASAAGRAADGAARGPGRANETPDTHPIPAGGAVVHLISPEVN